MARIPLPSSRDELDEAQRKVWDGVVSGPRGQVIGPLRAAIHNAELAERWSALGESLRFSTSLDKRLSELAISVTGRRRSCLLTPPDAADEKRGENLSGRSVL